MVHELSGASGFLHTNLMRTATLSDTKLAQWRLAVCNPRRDYYYTYSPLVSTNTIRAFLVVCCSKRLKIRQFDIKTAFLNGKFGDYVYKAVPQDVPIDDGFGCKLQRSLYGLKQAAAVWCKTIRAAFVDMRFIQCRANPCMFVRLVNDDRPSVYIILYVSDLFVGRCDLCST
ncbi:putative reverse transcriptase, RNA-dependent DNA polymerase [Plasmopara halstedii]